MITRTICCTLVSAEDAWKQTKWVHRNLCQAKHRNNRKNIKIQCCILCGFYKHLDDRGPKDRRKLCHFVNMIFDAFGRHRTDTKSLRRAFTHLILPLSFSHTPSVSCWFTASGLCAMFE